MISRDRPVKPGDDEGLLDDDDGLPGDYEEGLPDDDNGVPSDKDLPSHVNLSEIRVKKFGLQRSFKSKHIVVMRFLVYMKNEKNTS